MNHQGIFRKRGTRQQIFGPKYLVFQNCSAFIQRVSSFLLPVQVEHRQGQHMMIIDGGNDFKVFYTIYRTQLSAGMPGEQRKGLTVAVSSV